LSCTVKQYSERGVYLDMSFNNAYLKKK
jgi:hypothetical protein